MSRLFWRVVRSSVLLFCATTVLGAPGSEFGFLWVCTVRAAAQSGEPQKYVSGVVVGVYASGDKGLTVSYTLTDETGYAMIPLRPGSYCAEAYGTNGRKLRLDKNTNHGEPTCFRIAADKVLEAGITLADDETYAPKLPSKGVE